MSQLNSRVIVDGDAVFTEFKGALAEQYVFQQLTENENLLVRYFTFDNSKYEIDFLVQTENNQIIPIEVKSGVNLTANSFQLFCQKFKPAKAIRTSLADYKKEEVMTNIPFIRNKFGF